MTTKGSDVVKKIRAQQKLKPSSPPPDFSKLSTKLKPVTSKVRNVASSGSTKIRNLVTTGSTKFKKTVTPVTSKIKPTLSNIKSGVGDALNTRTGIGLRVKASQLKDIFIDKSRPRGGVPLTRGYLDLGKITKSKGRLPLIYKGSKGFLKKTPVIGTLISAALEHNEFKTTKQELIDKGYREKNAHKIALIKSMSSIAGGVAGGASGKWVGGGLGAVIGGGSGTVAAPVAGTAAGGLTGAGIGAGVGTVLGAGLGYQTGANVVAPLLIRLAGLKKTDAQLQSQLRARKQDEARVNIQSQKLQLSNAVGG
tara:strand:- start:46 stop:972 length:927 start_codon:yes stop_codon:yes gene_type:complete